MRQIAIQLEPGETEVAVLIKAAPVPVQKPVPKPVQRPRRPGPSLEAQRKAAAIAEIVRLVSGPLGKSAAALKREARSLCKEVGVRHEHNVGDPVIQRTRLAFSVGKPTPAVLEVVEVNLMKAAGLAKSMGAAGVFIAAQGALDFIASQKGTAPRREE